MEQTSPKPDLGKLVWEDDFIEFREKEVNKKDVGAPGEGTLLFLFVVDKTTQGVISQLPNYQIILQQNFGNSFRKLAKRIAGDCVKKCKEDLANYEKALTAIKEHLERFEKMERIYNITDGIGGDTAPGKIII